MQLAHDAAFAGSYAVQWLDSHVWQQERPFNVDTAADFWAQTYVAGHHNSNDESIVDEPRACRCHIAWSSLWASTPCPRAAAPGFELVSVVPVRFSDGFGERLMLTSVNDDVRVILDRRLAGQGVGESSIFAPLQIDVITDDTRVHVSGLDALDCENTHHNWNDVLVATRGDLAVRWSTRIDFDDAVSFLIYEVEVTNGGTVVIPLTRVPARVLSLRSCRYNACGGVWSPF